MIASIQDIEALRSIRPVDVAAYLRFTGWQKIRERSTLSSSWTKEVREEPYEVEVPMRHDLKDFARRMRDVLQELQDVEGRSQLEIFSDLLTTSADRVRIRAVARETEQGTVPLEAGVSCIESARDVILAAACSAVDPRSNYPTRKPAEALEYLKKLRLGQTEQGSFVINVLCPIPPELQSQTQLIDTEPYGRRVTQTLLRALHAASDASQQAVLSGNFDAFTESVQSGVSANLCDAIVRIGEALPEATLNFSMAWSKNRQSNMSSDSQVNFDPDFIPVLKEASRKFRDNTPEEDVQMVGYVVQVRRAENEAIGNVAITGLCGETVRRVVVLLQANDFALAARAIDERLPVSCRGDLIKVGRLYQLASPHEFRIFRESSDEHEFTSIFDFEQVERDV